MGFSTSGSLLVIFLALLIALGTLYSTAANTVERAKAGERDVLERRSAAQATDIDVARAEFDESAGSLTLEVANEGDAALSVNDTSVVVDSRYQPLSGFETLTVAGERTDIWRPGETLTLVDEDTPAPLSDAAADHVTVVTGTGVADLKQVKTV